MTALTVSRNVFTRIEKLNRAVPLSHQQVAFD